MKPTKIILTAEAELEDNGARAYCQILETKIKTINDRTKNHTLQIKELEKKVKELTQYRPNAKDINTLTTKK